MKFKLMVAVVAVLISSTVLFADEYAAAREKYETLAKQVKQMEGEVLVLRKENPACILKELSRSIVNLETKMPTQEQRRYYFRRVVHVRPHFYCTRCKGEHDDSPCRVSAKVSWPHWRDHYEKIKVTAEYDAKIDAKMSELDALQKQLAEAKKEKDDAMAALQKEKRRRGAK